MKRLIKRIVKDVLFDAGINIEIDDSENLENYGLDSLNFLLLVIDIESVFDVSFNENDIVYNNFCSIDSISKLLERTRRSHND